MVTPELVADTLVEVASQLANGYDTADFLHSVAEHAVTLTGAKAAAILLADAAGELRYMAATTERAEILQDLAEHHEDGPCQECFRTGEPVIATDLHEAGARWPVFAPRAVSLGYEAVHVLPLRFREHNIGTLKLFLPRQTPLDSTQVKIVQALADIFAITVLQGRNLDQAQTVNVQLQGALASRILIEQAKGALAQRLGVCADEAFLILRDHSRRHRQPLTDLCSDVINASGALAAVAAQVRVPSS